MFFPLAIYGRLKILSYLCTRLKAFFAYCKIQKRADFCSFLYFAICKEHLNLGAKIRYFSKYPMIYKRNFMEIRTFYSKTLLRK